MIEMNIQVKGLNQLRNNFKKAPALTLKYLSRATKASILEVEKKTGDGGSSNLFRFVTPRAKRTGQLAQSFGRGRRFSPDGLSGSIGPRVHYADDVYSGRAYRSGKPNKYMDRIARAAEPEVKKHFEEATEIIVSKLAKK